MSDRSTRDLYRKTRSASRLDRDRKAFGQKTTGTEPTSAICCIIPLVLLAGLACLTGCHRQYYRKQADAEAHALTMQKAACVARPSNADLSIQVDRRSRMYNPFDLDFQPMPLDDPASYRYMQCVDGRRGYPLWEAAGFTNTVESPDWYQFLPVDDDGVMVLNLENSVQIALLHSPEYQRQLEQLYLAALDVSTQRFAFDTQLFSSQGIAYQNSDFEFAQTNSSTSLLNASSDTLTMRRRFATGGNLVVGLANNIVWSFGSSSGRAVSTNALFTFTQPLLRRFNALSGGRDVLLEGLTQSERDLLAAVRSFERFRRSFFLNITVGRNIESQITNNGFSTNGTGFNVPNANGRQGSAGGYLGLLESQLNIRNLEENIARQAENVLILEDSLIEALTTIPDSVRDIVRQRLLVAQAKEGLVQAQTNLITSQAEYEADVDRFLIDLGLPPYICARIEDDFLKRFELIDRALLARRQELSSLRTTVGEINVAILENGDLIFEDEGSLPVAVLPWSEDLGSNLKRLMQELSPLAELTREIIDNELAAVTKDIARFEQTLPKRKLQAERLESTYNTEQEVVCRLLNVSDIDSKLFDLSNLETLGNDLRDTYTSVTERLKQYEKDAIQFNNALSEFLNSQPETLGDRELAAQVRDKFVLESQRLLSDLGDDVLALQLIQARARTESVVLPDVNIDAETAFYVARRNRRDYANAKAAVVDEWRNIEVIADALEANLDLTTSGFLTSTDDSVIPFQARDANFRVGLSWDTPLTRLIERNEYREQLIDFERVKRDFYRFEDSLWQLLRAEIRQLEVDQLSFELGRESIRIAAAQVELNADIRADEDARGIGAGPTAARDAINALDALLRAQNDLVGTFVSFETVRRSLDLDLGTMQLTPDGAWLDPGEIDAELLVGLPGTVDGAPRCCECVDCGLCYDPPPRAPDYHVPMIEADRLTPYQQDEPMTFEPPGSDENAGVEYPGEAIPVPATQSDQPMEILGPRTLIENVPVE